jgi:hypothetical protein
MAAPKQTDPQFKLRMTPKIKDQIEKAAAVNNRSMNAEILARLEMTLDGRIEKEMVELAPKVAEERGRREVAFESFQLTVGILAEASGNDKRTRELLAAAIRAEGTKNAELMAKARRETVERLAEMITQPLPVKSSGDDKPSE